MFPAYAQLDIASGGVADNDITKYCDDLPEWCGSPTTECVLLASDSEDECPTPQPRAPPAPALALAPYTCERRGERANKALSTLYCPARPQYCPRSTRVALGTTTWGYKRAGKSRWARYHAAHIMSTPVAALNELEQRALAFRRALADSPHDEELWHRYIDYQELCGSDADAMEAARAGCERLPRSGRLEQRLHDAAARALPSQEYLALLREQLAAGGRGAWARLLTALACGAAGAAGLGDSLHRATAAGLAATRGDPMAYPLMLYVYGSFLRSTGHMEELTQLVELVVAMNLPVVAETFPPPRDEERERRLDEELAAFERRVAAGGLPLGAVWARVERARAAAHWRPAARPDPADPARRPPPHRAAALLLAVVAPRALARLAQTLLRLAGVPPLPARGLDAGVAAGWVVADGAALATLVRAARRLPPAHPARPTPHEARALLALMPRGPSDDADGYGEWVEALWEVCLNAVGPEARLELVCWRLRELHLRVLLAEEGDEGRAEVRRARAKAKELLRRHAGGGAGAAAAYAGFARLERAAAGRERAVAAALLALRAAGGGAEAARLYAARVVCEVGARGGEVPPEGRAALLAALDAADEPAALARAEERCAEMEERWEGAAGEEEGEDGGGGAPDADEWGAARVLLAGPARRAELEAALLRAAPHWVSRGGQSARYAERCACALAARLHGAAAARLGQRLASLLPGNGYLALLAGGAPPWVAGGAGGVSLSAVRALARLLPAALGAVRAGWAGAAALRAGRAGRRAARAAGAGAAGGGRCAGGAALLALALAGVGAGPGAAGQLAAALEAAPHARALYVAGAAVAPAEARTLPDLMLDRGVRLHALPDELHDPV